MGSSNLATLFGPNILHKAKSSGEREYLVESTARAEERKEVIEVVKDMIDSNTSMFEVRRIFILFGQSIYSSN